MKVTYKNTKQNLNEANRRLESEIENLLESGYTVLEILDALGRNVYELETKVGDQMEDVKSVFIKTEDIIFRTIGSIQAMITNTIGRGDWDDIDPIA